MQFLTTTESYISLFFTLALMLVMLYFMIYRPQKKQEKKTGKEKYKQLAEEIWEYEESLYDVDIGNWVDVRNTEKCGGGVGAVAWCHGAAGILLSRLYCNELVNDKLWKERFAKDINRAYKTLKKYWKRDSWSLCHGTCGNLLILELVGNKLKDWDIENYINIPQDFNLLPQEMINPGFMLSLIHI